MLAKAPLVPAFTAGSHASTFGGTPIAMAAVAATIETMLETDAPAKAAAAGEYLMQRLREATDGLSNVVDIRGKGLLVGIQCAHPVADAVAELHRRGLLVVTAGPDVIRLLPNLLVTRDEIDEAVGKIAAVLREHAAKPVG
jgi:acetylornithine aminotransferase